MGRVVAKLKLTWKCKGTFGAEINEVKSKSNNEHCSYEHDNDNFEYFKGRAVNHFQYRDTIP